MNIDTLAGEGTSMKGRFKEGLGDALGDSELRSDGVADQVSGNTRKTFGALRDFARDQPVLTAVVVVVAVVALTGGLRSGRSSGDRQR